MKELEHGLIRNWAAQGQYHYPTSIRTRCPKCGELAIFSPSTPAVDERRLAVSLTATCPGCSQRIHFWYVSEDDITPTKQGNGILYVYPPPRDEFRPRVLSDAVPEPLRRALDSTIAAYASQNYVATAVSARRTLEGIFKYIIPHPSNGHTLAKLIDAARTEVDLAAPLAKLSHAVRDGGNLGAHFDAEKEPTREIALQMVQLVDYLVDYLYLLPSEIEKLESALAEAPLQDTDDQ